MREIVWLDEDTVKWLHQQLIDDFGGFASGVNEHLLRSALARPQQALFYADTQPDLYRLAACYGFGLVRNHCFGDGNKRVGLAAIDLFLQLNGFELKASEAAAVDVILRLAKGDWDEGQLSRWIERNTVELVLSELQG